MRILYVSRDYTPHDHRFLSAIAGSHHQAFFLRLERTGRQLEDRPLPAAVTQIQWVGGQRPLRWQDYPAMMLSLRKVLREVKPDLIHAGPVQNAAFLAALSGFRPLVTMSWGSDLLKDADRSLWSRWVTKFTLDRSTVLFADCQTVLHKAEQFGLPAERSVLFPWGVDLQHFSPQAGAQKALELRTRQGWGEDCFVVLSLRSWEPIYGVDVLVRGFARAARQNPDLRLLLLGGGSQAGLIRQILLDQGGLEKVYFGGQVSNQDLPAYYHAADLYVSASHSDGSSVSLMEALACGRPVLLSDIPSNREWVTEGEQGWFFPDGDDRILAERILQVAALSDQLPDVGQAARKLAERRADWKQNAARMLEGYDLAWKLARQR